MWLVRLYVLLFVPVLFLSSNMASAEIACPSGSPRQVGSCQACLDDSWNGTVTWQGSCVGGGIDGAGIIERFGEDGPQWRAQVGPGTGLSAKEGVIAWDLEPDSESRPKIASLKYCKGLGCSGASDTCQFAEQVPGVFDIGLGLPGTQPYISARVVVSPEVQLQYDDIFQRIISESFDRIDRDCARITQNAVNIRIELGQQATAYFKGPKMGRIDGTGFAWFDCMKGQMLGRGKISCQVERQNVFNFNFLQGLANERNALVVRKEREEKAKKDKIKADAVAQEKNQKQREFFSVFGDSVRIVFKKDIHTNPFSYLTSGPILLRGNFEQMLSADVGLFELNGGPVVLDNMNPMQFSKRNYVLVQIEVRGNKMIVLPDGRQALAIDGRYINSITCAKSGCDEFF